MPEKFAPLLLAHLLVASQVLETLRLKLRDGIDDHALELVTTGVEPLVDSQHGVVVAGRDNDRVPRAVSDGRLFTSWVPVLDDDVEELVPALNVEQ